MNQTKRWTTMALGGLLVFSAAVARSQLGAPAPPAPTKVTPLAKPAPTRVVPVLPRSGRTSVLVMTVNLGAAPGAVELDKGSWGIQDVDTGTVVLKGANAVVLHAKGPRRNVMTIKFVIPASANIGAARPTTGTGTGNITVVTSGNGFMTTAPIETVTPEIIPVDPCLD